MDAQYDSSRGRCGWAPPQPRSGGRGQMSWRGWREGKGQGPKVLCRNPRVVGAERVGDENSPVRKWWAMLTKQGAKPVSFVAKERFLQGKSKVQRRVFGALAVNLNKQDAVWIRRFRWLAHGLASRLRIHRK